MEKVELDAIRARRSKLDKNTITWAVYSQDVDALLRHIEAVEQERDHERHEKETVADAAKAHAEWSQKERDALATELTTLRAKKLESSSSGLRALLASKKAELTTLRARVKAARDHIADCFHCQQRGVCEEVESMLQPLPLPPTDAEKGKA